MYNWDFYEDLPEFHPITDANNLYDGFQAVRKGSGWKLEVQRMRWNLSHVLLQLQKELIALQYNLPGAYELQPYSLFELCERGVARPITALRGRDRVVKHVLNDLYLVPHVRQHLIYDNGASLKNRGVDFARRRIIAHLESYYREYGTNKGWIRLSDFSGFYDNIDHDLAYELICKWEPDALARKLTKQAYDSYSVDVSYMTDEEYERAKDEKFRMLDYRHAGHTSETRRKKLLHKSLSVGDPTSQITAIAYTTPIDLLMTAVHGQKYYEKYMDDTALISHDLEELQLLGEIFDREARKYKLFLNPRKTRICRIDRTFTFLQFRYRLTKNGHVVVRIGRKTVTTIRRRLKKLAKKIREDGKDPRRAEELFRSWIGSYKKVMSKRQIRNMVTLYCDLFGGGLDQWLKMCIK